MCGKVFVLRPQGGSEHELTDPLTSLCCLAPVLRCMFCVETKDVLLSMLERRSGVVFPFCPDCARSFAGQCRQISPLSFSVGSLTRFVARATVSVVFKTAHSPANAAVVLSSRNGLESIRCSRKSLFTENERNTREVSEALGAQLWYTNTCEVPEALRAAVRVCEPFDIF